MSSDKYYIDYRIGEVVKNLDTTFLAPEMYNEVIVDDHKDGMYVYTYIDEHDKRLAFHFNQLQLDNSMVSWEEMLEDHCSKYDFKPLYIIDKYMFITQEKFDKAYKTG